MSQAWRGVHISAVQHGPMIAELHPRPAANGSEIWGLVLRVEDRSAPDVHITGLELADLEALARLCDRVLCLVKSGSKRVALDTTDDSPVIEFDAWNGQGQSGH